MLLAILDSIGYLIVAGVLFFPVFWFVGYFIWETIHYKRWMTQTTFLEETVVETKTPTRIKPVPVQRGKRGEIGREAA